MSATCCKRECFAETEKINGQSSEINGMASSPRHLSAFFCRTNWNERKMLAGEIGRAIHSSRRIGLER